ncbi:tetratricopeptide repeat protein [Teladorsagia circumcincta]|uniref:Tetratricopeptide repeat protein n=1 Tax=Teladorsagia circumcincta TaxID=45464 RepID=A0A2G9URK9_TELCI|nr:tetratricopeptide repeat protein [Teladorsagia circumcincta]
MFRTVICRIAASAAGVQICAAGVALTDKELAKKPEWYRKDVLALEDSLKKLGRHGFNTSPSAVNNAYETLKKYAHISNVEVHWRMARALLEKSYFTKCPTERAHLVHEAKDCAKKALSFETDKPSAGAHKWYAIALSNLEEIDSKADHSAEILKHLEHAANIDKEDAYTVFLLGVAHYKKKNYSEALTHFQKAETMRKHFSSSNLYYMGMAYHASGNKEEAIKHFIDSYKVRPKNEHELKSRALAKTMLMKLKVNREDYEVEEY